MTNIIIHCKNAKNLEHLIASFDVIRNPFEIFKTTSQVKDGYSGYRGTVLSLIHEMKVADANNGDDCRCIKGLDHTFCCRTWERK